MGADITMSGPLFDGAAERALSAACDDVREDIAEFAEEQVMDGLGMFLQHPTGYYESHITTQHVDSSTDRVWDQGIVYGPWLAGVGSRNYPVTRFRGYKHWDNARTLTEARSRMIADNTIARHMPGVR